VNCGPPGGAAWPRAAWKSPECWQFLRLMKAYRDGRKLIGSMTVLGGQVNVAEQQIVAKGE
jgi:hypothetical protein